MFFKHTFDIADGSRLLDSEQNHLWFVYAGKRHHVVCQNVYSALFAPEIQLSETAYSVLESVAEGPELMAGTSLVRREGSIMVNLLAIHPRGVILHPIPDKDIFDRCGFDLTLCRSLSAKIFDQIRIGAALS